MSWPVSSEEARELRDRELEDLSPAAAGVEHDPTCDGWLGEDAEGRPVPCVICRPHLVAYGGRVVHRRTMARRLREGG